MDVLMVIYGDDGKSEEWILADRHLCTDELESDQFEVK